MTNAEMKNKWIENVCDYLANKTKGKNTFNFSADYECNSYTGRSFHEQIAEPYTRGYYKWCAVNKDHNFVIFYCGEREAQTYFKSKFNNDPPAVCITLEECKSADVSKNDKELLDKIYDEMCMRIHGMNEQVNKLFVQVEKEFEIQRDSEIMFEFIENKEEDNNAKSD
jgi:hypothetical protein